MKQQDCSEIKIWNGKDSYAQRVNKWCYCLIQFLTFLSTNCNLADISTVCFEEFQGFMKEFERAHAACKMPVSLACCTHLVTHHTYVCQFNTWWCQNRLLRMADQKWHLLQWYFTAATTLVW